jgi:hypothetical protein
VGFLFPPLSQAAIAKTDREAESQGWIGENGRGGLTFDILHGVRKFKRID